MSDQRPAEAIDPYCPTHGDKPTAYETCSCAGRAAMSHTLRRYLDSTPVIPQEKVEALLSGELPEGWERPTWDVSPKPPLGLVPKRIHDERRLQEIDAAIERYREARYEIPFEWLMERAQLVQPFSDELLDVLDPLPSQEKWAP